MYEGQACNAVICSAGYAFAVVAVCVLFGVGVWLSSDADMFVPL